MKRQKLSASGKLKETASRTAAEELDNDGGGGGGGAMAHAAAEAGDDLGTAISLDALGQLYDPKERTALPSADAMPLASRSADQAVQQYLQRVLDPATVSRVFDEKLRLRALALDNARTVAAGQSLDLLLQSDASADAPISGSQAAAGSKRTHSAKRNKRPMSSRERRAKGLLDVDLTNHTYADFVPLHALWTEYIVEMLAGTTASGYAAKLIKADFHGAIITVARAKNPCDVGLQGIVVQELQNVFKLVCTDNKVRTIPKPNHVFTLQISQYVVHIYGSQFCYKSSERAVARKFKYRPSIAL